tara:strand:- start:332 stop:742 length:411 start_codon:yes stop_codon:yes gene_type:complete
LSRQNKKTGGWEVLDADFKNSYHATICALGALLTPKMTGVAEKVSVFGGGSVARNQSGNTGTAKSGSAKNPNPPTTVNRTGVRQSTRAVEKIARVELEQRERREVWDKQRARPWERGRGASANEKKAGAKRPRRAI